MINIYNAASPERRAFLNNLATGASDTSIEAARARNAVKSIRVAAHDVGRFLRAATPLPFGLSKRPSVQSKPP